jgi:hypothetical protein
LEIPLQVLFHCVFKKQYAPKIRRIVLLESESLIFNDLPVTVATILTHVAAAALALTLICFIGTSLSLLSLTTRLTGILLSTCVATLLLSALSLSALLAAALILSLLTLTLILTTVALLTTLVHVFVCHNFLFFMVNEYRNK